MRLSPITLGLAALGLFAFFKGKAASQLEIIASKASNIKGTLLTLSFDLELTVQNFSNQNLTVTGVSGNVMLNGTPIAGTLRNIPFTIAANGYSKVVIPTVIQFPYLIGAVKQYIVDFIAKKTRLVLGWSGTVSSYKVPFKVSTEFELIP